MVNVGIIGLGFMAATHLRAFQQIEGVRIAAVCNPSGRNLDGNLSQVSGNMDTGKPLQLDMSRVAAFKDVEAFMNDAQVDLIDLCVPTACHEALSIQALSTGRHVLCEKPMTRTVDAAQRIVAAAASAKGFYMPAMCLRFWPEWAWLKDAIDRNLFGKILAARFRRVAEPPQWGKKTFFNGAESGGALFDLHIHDSNFVLHCFGRPRRVTSAGYSKLSGAVDHVVTHYEVACGAMVHAEGSWAMTRGFGFNMAFTVNFEGATVDYDLGRGPDALKVYEKDQDARVVVCEGPDGYVRELAHMVEAIESKRPPTRVTARDGLASVILCAAEEESVRTGQPVFCKA
jgi:predicted dehydrogenase